MLGKVVRDEKAGDEEPRKGDEKSAASESKRDSKVDDNGEEGQSAVVE
jgi:hypothetical protein